MVIPLLIRFRVPLLALGAALALFIAFRVYVSAQVEKARAEDAAEAQRMDSVADDVAGQIAASEAANVEKGNTDARNAAAGSDDPLKRGLDSLRASKGGNREASR
jgi:hypothetical protein